MTEPREDDENVNLHPGQRDEGGEGGMATREFAAKAKGAEERGDEVAND
jgi:hypothetical protein